LGNHDENDRSHSVDRQSDNPSTEVGPLIPGDSGAIVENLGARPSGDDRSYRQPEWTTSNMPATPRSRTLWGSSGPDRRCVYE